ncbi:MAG: hypothetical protein JO264_13350 [Acidisphaera sp.]|nr:hypothetical protein [Acidisphaera sp.]
MSETETDPPVERSVEELRAHAEALERQLREASEAAHTRLVRAELKAEALRAGMVDLDGLKLLDLSSVKLNEAGEVDGAAALMSELKGRKPWLFGGASSSSRAAPPPSQPPKAKLATEMSVDEWRAARADMLRRR